MRSWVFDHTSALEVDGTLSCRVLFLAEVVSAETQRLRPSNDDVTDFISGAAPT